MIQSSKMLFILQRLIYVHMIWHWNTTYINDVNNTFLSKYFHTCFSKTVHNLKGLHLGPAIRSPTFKVVYWSSHCRNKVLKPIYWILFQFSTEQFFGHALFFCLSVLLESNVFYMVYFIIRVNLMDQTWFLTNILVSKRGSRK